MTFLKKKIGPISIWWLAILLLLSIIGILIGSFCDLSISNAIASQNSVFGILIEQFTPFLGSLVVPFAMAMVTRKLFNRNIKIGLNILAGVIVGILTVVVAYFNNNYFSGQGGYLWNFNEWVGFALLIVIYASAFFLARHFVDETLPTETLVKNGVIILAGYVISVFFINLVLKGLIYRTRYRAIMWDNATLGTTALGESYYQPWYVFAFYKKPDWFLNSNLPSDFIKSWPSGHTATASFLLFLPLFTQTLKKRSEKADTIVFILAAVYTLVVAFGRVRFGAHYLSDVSFGLLFGILFNFLPVLLVNFIFKKIYKEKKE